MLLRHSKSTSEFISKNSIDLTNGLSSDEARRRLIKYGRNAIASPERSTAFQMFFEEFEDSLVRILLLCAFFSFCVAVFSGEPSDLVEPLAVLSILILNALVSCWQKRRADDAIEALNDLSPKSVIVLRDGSMQEIESAQIVPGDVIQLSVGQHVPADSQILQVNSTTLRIDESALTGESVESCKAIAEMCECPDETSRFAAYMAFSGTFVTHGKATAAVCDVGYHTEIGKIDALLRSTSKNNKTPLQRAMDQFGELLAVWIGRACFAVFCVQLVRSMILDCSLASLPNTLLHSLKVSIALAVAAIPEGLPAVVTTCLAIGARRMAKRNAIVRSLPSVETIGCCDVICSDKTGTLTTNEMCVAEIRTLAEIKKMRVYNLQETQDSSARAPVEKWPTYFPGNEDEALPFLAAGAALCNDAKLGEKTVNCTGKHTGEQTEVALLLAARKIIEDSQTNKCSTFVQSFKKVQTFAFTQGRKAMSILAQSADKNILFVKGAPEVIIAASQSIVLNDGLRIPMSLSLREFLLKEQNAMSGARVLRVLAFAFRDVLEFDSAKQPRKPEDFAAMEQNLTFCGFVGMTDPIRSEVPRAIVACQSAGIRVIVITGDAKETAEAVCTQIGLLKPKERKYSLRSTADQLAHASMTAENFRKLSNSQQHAFLCEAVVFSRADPAFKQFLVKLLQNRSNSIVAMTGDGVNDGPALKAADIGVGMGSGTDVARAASDIVLADNNFGTIVEAVREGRAIFANTKQFIRYLISSNIGEVVCVFLAGLCGLPDVLEPVQLLWVNLVTDGLPAIALGFNPPDPDVMQMPPRSPRDGFLSRWVLLRYCVIGAYIGIATLWGFLSWFHQHGFTLREVLNPSLCSSNQWKRETLHDPREARTLAFTILVFVELFNALNSLSETSSLMRMPPKRNLWLVAAIVLSAVLQCAVLYVPSLQALFRTAPLGAAAGMRQNSWALMGWNEWAMVLKLSVPVVLLDEGLKLITRGL